MKKKVILFLTIILIVMISVLIDIPVLEANGLSKKQSIELPKMYFTGNISHLSTKKEEANISVKYESSDFVFDAYAKIKLQGSSSLSYDKKNYNIKFYDDAEFNNKLNVDLGWGKANKYCLKANWIDKTHARNIVTANIVADMQKKYNLFTDTPNYGAIDGYPIEIYVNNEFLGLYTLNIPKDDWMFNMDDDNKDNLVFASEGWNLANLFKSKGTFADWGIEVGEENDYSLDKLNRLLEFVANSTDEEFKQNINSYFNLDSLLNYYVMMQFANLVDNVGKNALLVTYDGNIWYTSLYDLDTSWGTNWNGLTTLDYNYAINTENNLLWSKLLRCYPNEVANRYFEFRKDIFTKEYVMNKFNEFVDSIPDSVYEKESTRWKKIPGYDLTQIDNYLNARIPVLDNYFGNMYTTKSVVNVVYSKNDSGTVTAKVVSKNNNVKCINTCSYEFKKDGEFTFYFDDYIGNVNSITAKVIGINYEL